MAAKRVKPIRISLTEEQIAEVIRNTVKSRKGFSIESLEDRIAPSRIGLPIGGGIEDSLPDGGDSPDIGGGDDTTVGGDGSTAEGGGYEPPLPGSDPDLPGGEPPLPGSDPTLPGGGEPPLPGLNPDPNFQPHNPFGGETPGADGSAAGPNSGLADNPENMTQHQRQQWMRQERMSGDPVGPDGAIQEVPQQEVTPEEMRAHRQAILRQLRGQ